MVGVLDEDCSEPLLQFNRHQPLQDKTLKGEFNKIMRFKKTNKRKDFSTWYLVLVMMWDLFFEISALRLLLLTQYSGGELNVITDAQIILNLNNSRNNGPRTSPSLTFNTVRYKLSENIQSNRDIVFGKNTVLLSFSDVLLQWFEHHGQYFIYLYWGGSGGH